MRHWLLQHRKIKGYTQKKAAELSGISRSYYADIERGDKGASGRAAKLISDVLGFDMSLFFADIGRKTSHKRNKGSLHDAKERDA